MASRAIPKVRFRLISLVLTCIVTAFLIAGILIAHDYRRSQVKFVSNACATTCANAVAIDNGLAIVTPALFSLSISSSLSRLELTIFEAQACQLKKRVFLISCRKTQQGSCLVQCHHGQGLLLNHFHTC